MLRVENANFPYYIFSSLEKFDHEILHLTSTRFGGQSKPPYGQFNLGFQTGEARSVVEQNFLRIADRFTIRRDQIIIPGQIHGNQIGIIDQTFFENSQEKQSHILENKDGLITDIKGVMLVVRAADCGNILIFDPIRRVIAAVHAGWRGVVAEITPKTISLMQKNFGCNPSDLMAAVGPCIGINAYEVGNEVVETFAKLFGSNPTVIDRTYPKPHVDVAEANRQQLINAGLHPEKIEMSGICTYENTEHFYSARKGDQGRFCSLIMLR